MRLRVRLIILDREPTTVVAIETIRTQRQNYTQIPILERNRKRVSDMTPKVEQLNILQLPEARSQLQGQRISKQI